MAYKCCDKDFDDKKSFLKHIRSSKWHFLTSSDFIRLDLNYEDCLRIIQNKDLIYNSIGIVRLKENIGFLSLPISREFYGNVLKTGILGKISGPNYNLGLINYTFNSKNLIYEISFRPRKIPDKTEITSVVTMRINIGLSGKIFPSSALKSLQKLLLPEKVLSDLDSQLSTFIKTKA